ncbi:MAG: zinc-ribbon domain-containing protein [Calditrichaeota bacterium]|nr:zinc-ribbon domain-containing protein [Calditrichota bacterium]
MICPNCGKINENDARFCNYCGISLKKKQQKVCPNCGEENLPEARYCVSCGTRIASEARSPKNRGKRSKGREQPVHSSRTFLLTLAAIVGLFFVAILLVKQSDQTNYSRNASSPVVNPTVADPATEALVVAVAEKFICACGGCPQLDLVDCDCDAATRQKNYIREQLQQGRSMEEVIAMVKTTFGGFKE